MYLVWSCRLSLMTLFALDAPGQEACQLVQDLAGSLQQLHRRPYLPRGLPERVLLLMASLMQVPALLLSVCQARPVVG